MFHRPHSLGQLGSPKSARNNPPHLERFQSSDPKFLAPSENIVNSLTQRLFNDLRYGQPWLTKAGAATHVDRTNSSYANADRATRANHRSAADTARPGSVLACAVTLERNRVVRILVVEDDVLTGMALEAQLEASESA